MSRRYTIEDYRADLQRLDARDRATALRTSLAHPDAQPVSGLRRHDGTALRMLLDAMVTADADLVPAEAPFPLARRVEPRRTLLGVAAPAAPANRWRAAARVLAELEAEDPMPPVTPAVLRAVGLSPRPSGRVR